MRNGQFIGGTSFLLIVLIFSWLFQKIYTARFVPVVIWKQSWLAEVMVHVTSRSNQSTAVFAFASFGTRRNLFEKPRNAPISLRSIPSLFSVRGSWCDIVRRAHGVISWEGLMASNQVLRGIEWFVVRCRETRLSADERACINGWAFQFPCQIATQALYWRFGELFMRFRFLLMFT